MCTQYIHTVGCRLQLEFMKCFRAFARGSCGLHCEFVYIWLLVKLCGLHMYVRTHTTCTHWRLPLFKITYIYTVCVYIICRSRSMWCSATRFSKMVHESVNKVLDIHVVKGPGFAWISPSQRSTSPLQRLMHPLQSFAKDSWWVQILSFFLIPYMYMYVHLYVHAIHVHVHTQYIHVHMSMHHTYVLHSYIQCNWLWQKKKTT